MKQFREFQHWFLMSFRTKFSLRSNWVVFQGFPGKFKPFVHRPLVVVDIRVPWYAMLGVALKDLSGTDGKYKSGECERTKMNL